MNALIDPPDMPRAPRADAKPAPPRLVFLPGLFMTQAAWEPLCRQLGLSHRLMLDLPGHRPGDSAAEVARSLQSGSWLDEMAAQIAGFSDGRGVHLVGHSTGGLVSLLLARRMPDLVRSMILIGAPVTGKRDRPRDMSATLFCT